MFIPTFVPTQDYDQEGIQRLSQALQATLRYNRWSDRELARKAGISHGTANRYAKGRILIPQDEILKALAPYIYIVVAINADGVEIDPSQTYSNWMDLASIALKNWNTGERKVEKLASLIFEYMRQNNLNAEEFAQRALLSPAEIRAILDGQMPGDPQTQLSLIASILSNPDTNQTFTGWLELAEYCGFNIQKSSAPGHEQEQNGKHDRLYC